MSAQNLSEQSFYDQVQAIVARYPDPRSASLPALRLAQERHGYMTPDALRETADALGVTPAFCESVATFYDMFHLEPVGRHKVEVCTNLACALAGARGVVDILATELGIEPGGTTEDGEITFRTVECLGGCGYATVVSVDERYRQNVTAENAAEIVRELRSGGPSGGD
jgi:NADH-quinone oxidoreductase subunit E